MSYSEENGQVVLRMSREDYGSLLIALGIAAGWAMMNQGKPSDMLAFVDRLNSGNPNYTPYQVEKPHSRG